MAVGAQRLEIAGIFVVMVPVDVVDIQLTHVLRHKPAMSADLVKVDSVRTKNQVPL